MLVLTRRANQSLMIGHDIVITVLEIRGDQIRLGIRAPREVGVYREELFAAMQQANRSAASPSETSLRSLEAFVAPREDTRARADETVASDDPGPDALDDARDDG